MWKGGQFPVNYMRWYPAMQSYKVTWTPCFELYIAVSRMVPKLDTILFGIGWNTVVHSMVLNSKWQSLIHNHKKKSGNLAM